jgi:hypothetical protein
MGYGMGFGKRVTSGFATPAHTSSCISCELAIQWCSNDNLNIFSIIYDSLEKVQAAIHHLEEEFHVL